MTVAELAGLLRADYAGDGETALTGVGAPGLAQAGDVVVVFQAAALESAERGPAAALVVPLELASAKPHIRVADPKAALVQVLHAFDPPVPEARGVHPTAHVAASAVVGADLTVGPGAVIGERVVLGNGCRIGANAVIGDDCRLGDAVRLDANVTLYQGVTIGDRCRLHSGVCIGGDGFGYYPQHDAEGNVVAQIRIPQLGTVIVESDVEIGCNSVVDRATVGATVIGAGSKMDSLVMIGHNVRLGRRCILVAQAGVAGSSSLGDDVVVAGQAGIADHLSVGSGARIGGQAGVMRDVTPGSRMVGSPAMTEQEFFRFYSSLSRLRGLFERVRSLERKVDGDRGTGGRGQA